MRDWFVAVAWMRSSKLRFCPIGAVPKAKVIPKLPSHCSEHTHRPANHPRRIDSSCPFRRLESWEAYFFGSGRQKTPRQEWHFRPPALICLTFVCGADGSGVATLTRGRNLESKKLKWAWIPFEMSRFRQRTAPAAHHCLAIVKARCISKHLVAQAAIRNAEHTQMLHERAFCE